MAERNKQVARIYTILQILENSRNGLTVKELHEAAKYRGHEASARTIYRDLEALQSAGFPLISEETGTGFQATRWKHDGYSRVRDYFVLNARELFALFLARNVLTPLRDTPFFQDLDGVFKKIEDRLGKNHLEHIQEIANDFHFQPGPRWGLGLDPDVLDTLQSCCSERQCIEVVYYSVNSGAESTRKLGPHFLYFAQGSLYLVAEDFGDKKVKVFSVPRMKSATMLDDEYSTPQVKPELYFGDSLGVFVGGDLIKVEIEFSAKVASYVKERRWHPSQQVISRGNGTITLKLEVSQTPELLQWVLGFGPEAKILGPVSLQEAIRLAAEKTVAMYRGRAA